MERIPRRWLSSVAVLVVVVGCYRWLLVVGRWSLVVGCWLLVVVCWLLVVSGCRWLLTVGCWLLIVGCWLLHPPTNHNFGGGELGCFDATICNLLFFYPVIHISSGSGFPKHGNLFVSLVILPLFFLGETYLKSPTAGPKVVPGISTLPHR